MGEGAMDTPGGCVEAMPLSRAHVWLCAAMSLLYMCNGMGMESALFVFPRMQSDLGIATRELGFVFSSQWGGSLLGTIVLSFVESAGRRRSLMMWMVVAAAGCVVQALADGLGMLVTGRIIAGFGMGAAYPIGMGLLAELLPAQRRSTLLIIPHLGYPTGALLALAAAAAEVPWRITLALPLLPVVGWLMLSAVFIPESPRFLDCAGRTSEAWEVVRGLHSMAGLPVPAEVAEGACRVPSEGSSSSRRELGVSAFTWEELVSSGTIRKMGVVSCVWVCLAFASQLMHVWLPYYTRQIANGGEAISREDGVVELPYVSVAVFFSMDFAGIAVGSILSDKIGFLQPVRAGMLLAAATSFATLSVDNLPTDTLFGGVQQGSQALCWVTIGALGTSLFPTVIRTTAHSTLRLVESFGMVVGPAVGGTVVGLSTESGLSLAVALGGSVYAIGFLATYLIRDTDDPAHSSLEDSITESTDKQKLVDKTAEPSVYGASA
mmetsp:Transcript_99245/g.265430  ORF Transcript_99245/g.265430 Transcript_99245/m.265430 type:complete len:492 (+) Transcript_99245:34-1509(+)